MQINTSRTKGAISLLSANAVGGVRLHPRRKAKILVENDHLEPHYRRGEVLAMDPSIIARRGDIVLTRESDGSLHLGHLKDDYGCNVIASPRSAPSGDLPRVVAVYRPR